ncbi:MAG: hypothetical protein ABIH76_04795 [Candidatus Bathyarchaeota archaeon]
MRLTPRQQRAKDRYMRKKYEKDLIQPSDDSRFKKHYPKQWADMEKTRYDLEIKAKQKKESRDKFFEKYKTGIHSKEMRNMLKLEEQLEHGRK